MLVGLEWEGDKLVINGHDPFVNPERIGKSYTDGNFHWIEVQIEDRRYTTNKDRVGVATHYVPDPNLLCQYLAGDVEAEAVAAAATEFAKQASLIEDLHQTIRDLESQLAEERESRRRDRELMVDLAKELRRKWFLRPEARAVLFCESATSQPEE
ncbi:MAG: hypothetical protein AAB455_02035 [Patescibacteria group bacterium]